MSRSAIVAGCVVLVCAWFTPFAQAELLELTPDHYPLVFSDGIQVTYVAGGSPEGMGLLTASGWVEELYEENDDVVTYLYGDFYLEMVIDPSTEEILGGELSVNDYENGPVVDLFYSQTPTAFSYSESGLMHILFTQEGEGMLAPNDEPIGIILTCNTTISSLEGNFSNSGDGVSSTFYLPEPSILLLLAVGAGIPLRRRRPRTA